MDARDMTKKKINDDWPEWDASKFGQQLRPSPKTYTWNPRKDITSYELARAIEVMMTGMMKGDVDLAFDRLPAEAKRHFKVMQ
jgi:hypothetical protein